MSIARKTPLPRSTTRLRPKKKRTAAEERARQERIYGTKAHRDWLHKQPCAVTGWSGTAWNPIVAAHTKGDGGTSYKASAQFQLPMLDSLHKELHRIGPETFEAKHNVSLVELAAACYARWLAFSGEAVA